MSKKAVGIFGGLVCLAALGYSRYVYFETNQEFKSFFDTIEDRRWALLFAYKTINYCTQGWPSTIPLTGDDNGIYTSPNGLYRAQVAEQPDGITESLVVRDIAKGQDVLSAKHVANGIEVRWVLEDRYVIYLLQVAKDDDFGVPQVYMGNLRTGKSIYVANATVSNCEEIADLH